MSRFCLLFLFLFANLDPSFSYDEINLEYIVTKHCQNYVSELILQLEEKHKIEMDSVKAQMKEITTKQAERDEKHNLEMDALRTELKEITTRQSEQDEKHSMAMDALRTELKEITTRQSERDEKHSMEMDALKTDLKEITTRQSERDEKHNFEIHALKDKIRKEISVRNNKHITETEALRSNVKELHTHQVELGVQVEKLTSTIHTLKDKEESVISDGNLSRSDLSAATNSKRLQATKSALEKYKKKTQIRDFATEHHIRRDVEHKVAFLAYLSSDILHLGADQDIVFDHIVTNIGNAYNGRHGVFIAPVGGTYVFSGTLVVHGSPTSWGHFVVNRQVVAKFYLAPMEQSSQTIVVTLNAGDDVSLQNTASDRQIFGEGGYSTFSGFLLYEEYANNPIVG